MRIILFTLVKQSYKKKKRVNDFDILKTNLVDLIDLFIHSALSAFMKLNELIQ